MSTSDLINFPTYDQILAIAPSSEVEVHLRERSGERCKVSGLIFAPEQGKRKVGPFTLAYHIARVSEFSRVRAGNHVPENVVAIRIIRSAAAQ